MVTGSTAGTIYGEPRLPHDVDIVVALSLAQVPSFVAAFPTEEFYCPPDDVPRLGLAAEWTHASQST